MHFILFIFLSGVCSSNISDVPSSNEEVNVEPVMDEKHKEEEIKHDIPANDKDNHHFQDEKNYVFTTHTPGGTSSEISVKATTAVDFFLRNYKPNETTETPSEELPAKHVPKTTEGPNEPAFWTMLAKVLNETVREEEGRDELYQAIPSSDLNATNEEKVEGKQDGKLKIMLGISLLILLLFTVLLALSSALLYRLNTDYKEQLNNSSPVQPEMDTLSYYQPVAGISDTSISKSTVLDPRSNSRTMDVTTSDEDMS